MTHFHLKYVPYPGKAAVNYGASFCSEMEALHAAALANATRGNDTGYYVTQSCRRGACRPGQDLLNSRTRRAATGPRSGVLN